MGAAAGKFPEWIVFGGYFAVIFALTLISFPWLPDLIEWLHAVGNQTIPIVVMDLWREPDTRGIIIGLIGTVAILIIIIILGAAFETIGGMIYWEIMIFKALLEEHREWLEDYVDKNMPRFRDDYNKLADPKGKASVWMFGRHNRELRRSYERLSAAFNAIIDSQPSANSLWYVQKAQAFRVFRTIALITYLGFMFVLLSRGAAYLYETWMWRWRWPWFSNDPDAFFCLLLIVGIWFGYALSIHWFLRKAAQGLWRPMFTLLQFAVQKAEDRASCTTNDAGPT